MLTLSVNDDTFFIDGFPCPITGNPDNFTLVAGYPNPLWTTHTHLFRLICDGGRGSAFCLNIQCKVEKQGLPINFTEEMTGSECTG